MRRFDQNMKEGRDSSNNQLQMMGYRQVKIKMIVQIQTKLTHLKLMGWLVISCLNYVIEVGKGLMVQKLKPIE